MVSVSDFNRFVFIVGAPRCGTTTLAQFLKAHPAVSFPVVKEPHFFSQNDLRGLGDDELRSRVEREYLRRFFISRPGRRTAADASVTYLYTPEQLEPILRLWPDSRFVIAVRDPLTMLPSLHRRLIYLGDETIPSFEQAWAAVPDRAEGRRIPRRCADPRWLRYDQAGRLATHLERLFAVVGRDRCMVHLFDDLAADPAASYRQLMEFVGVPPQSRTDFSICRPSKKVRFRWLQRALKRPPVAVREYFAGEQFRQRISDLDNRDRRKAPGTILSIRKRLLEWNRVTAPPEPLSPALQAQIRREFEGEVDRLGQLLGRDLGHWLQRRCEMPVEQTANEMPLTERRREAFSL